MPETTHEGNDPMGALTTHRGPLENCPAPECQDRVIEQQEEAEPTATVAGQSIALHVTGYPDVPNRWGSGHIRATSLRLDYGNNRTPDGRHAFITGLWIRENGEVTDQPIDQYYDAPAGDTSTWPEWIAELARQHTPTDRATVLREAAAAIETEQNREEATELARFGELDHETELGRGYVLASAALLRRLADEAQQQPATAVPSGDEPCRCGHSKKRHMGDQHERGCHACWDSPGNEGWAHPFSPKGQQDAEVPQPVQHAPGRAVLCPDCRAKGRSVCVDDVGSDGCTCGSAGDGFVPLGHYRDCPAAATEPHPTEADVRHALAVLDKFNGQDTSKDA